MDPCSISVLLVDDFAPFRQFLSSSLRDVSSGFVCREACDGLEAVHKAEELQPDLILLDIGLPRLNGIGAARQIAKASPGSKILFLSQESSPDVVREAYRAGARGYVVKTDAGCELLTAVEAVLRGARYVSSRFDGHDFPGAPGTRVGKPRCGRRHEAHFYSNDVQFVEQLTAFIESELRAGKAVIALATEAHRNSLLLTLEARGVDIAAAIEQGRYIALDAAGALANFMVNDRLDRARFSKATGDLIARAAQAVGGEHGHVAACGECAPLLWAQGNPEAALLLEHLWDEVAASLDLDILCGYVLSGFQREQESHIYDGICAEHSAVSSR